MPVAFLLPIASGPFEMPTARNACGGYCGLMPVAYCLPVGRYKHAIAEWDRGDKWDRWDDLFWSKLESRYWVFATDENAGKLRPSADGLQSGVSFVLFVLKIGRRRLCRLRMTLT
jgi:hypothetical protein